MSRGISKNAALIAALLGLALPTACGSSESDSQQPTGGAPGPFSTSLPGDKPLGSLSDQESKQLCQEFDAYFSSAPVQRQTKDLACRLAGLLVATFSQAKSDAEARAACQQVYDPCLAAPSNAQPSTCRKPSADCTATVAELKTCFSDSTAAWPALVAQVPSCSSLTLADLKQTSGPAETSSNPASCEALQAKCPSAPQPPSLSKNSAP